MTRIERSIEIDQPPDAVFDVLIDLDRLPDWATNVVDTGDISETPIRTGSSFRQTVRIGGRTLDTEWRVTQLERPRQIAYAATAVGGGTLAMKQMVSAADGGSRVVLELDYEIPGGFLAHIVDRAYIERRNEREVEHSLHNLKELLEGQWSEPLRGR
jgi:uncharacterized membrane protein